MSRYRRRGGLFPLVLAVAGLLFAAPLGADERVVPELSLYWTHNHMFRSRFATNATWSEDKSDFTGASFEYDLDLSVLSFFRRYVFKDPNVEKSKRVSFRAGYAFYPDIVTGSGGLDEHRGIGEVTFRVPLGNVWLLSDRNRGEYRKIGNLESGRYRNRLRMERNSAVGRFRLTPYVNAEAFFDGRTDEWNQADGTVGSEFPWYYRTIMEFYFTYQMVKDSDDNKVIGITLQKHI